VILTREIEIGGRILKVILGKTARQADGAAWVQYGDTVLHVAAVSAKERREGLDFLPLTVDYREKYYAAGKIPGGFFKREGRPHEKEILAARMIDRPIRPLFPEGYAYETQVMAIVISADGENDAEVLGPIGASLALNMSDIPMNETVASVRVGLNDGQYLINPTNSQLDESRLALFIVGTLDAITMVEGYADEVSNQELIDAIFFGHEAIKKIVEFQNEIIALIKKPTRAYTLVAHDEELVAKVNSLASDEVVAICKLTDKSQRKEHTSALIDRLVVETEATPDKLGEIKGAVKELMKHEVRSNILNHNIRIDGRCDTDIREIECEVGLLPRTHGSSLFTRGQTQALGTVTLGTKLDEQKIDNLDEDGYHKYMLHYAFPPYSTGEVKNSFGVSRREVGHGKLGERAIQAVLPDWDDFPYTVRVTSDILESNGSSSMASVCAGSLALMDAGVPLKKAVAGIAMGLIKEGDNTRILTDILGDEDHLGDMDFKVAGTRDGITSFQMDIKIKGISAELMARALTQARDARHHILDIMDRTIDRPRSSISPYAPKFITLRIPVDRIGALIGPGGKNIRSIIADTGATIDVEDDGTVRIGAVDGPSGEAARQRVEEITAVPEAGKVYSGTIKRIMDFGAFVEIIPGVEGLMHVSQIDIKRVDRVSDYFQVGDKVDVKLLKIENDGKLDLSRKVLLPGYEGTGESERERPRSSGGGGFGRGGGGGRGR
jgi:polyribonucleotide nucleotidyltransferase